MKLLITLFCAIGIIFQTHAQKQEAASPILFIYDASGSMWGQLQGMTKKEIAANVLSDAVNNLPANQNIGLIAYGHRKKGNCNDIEYLADLKNSSKDKVIKAVKEINSLGKTPLARSATIAINSLRDSKTKATIILVTDGIESCDGNICNVVTAAKAEGIDFKLHIVGFGLKEGETEQLKCAAKAGDGNYYDASDASGLGDVLNEATTESVDDPPGNFSVYAVKNGEPVDAWIKAYKTGTKDAVDSGRSYRDSAWVYLPPGKYDINVKPLENTDISGTRITVEIKEGEIKHKTISFDGGKIEVTTTNNDDGWDAMIKVIDRETGKPVSTTRTYGRMQTMEMNPGTYDVTYQALVMKGMYTFHKMENVEIIAGETKVLSHNFETGIAMIGVKTASGELIDATVNFKEMVSGKWIAGSRTYTSSNNNPRKFLLNPGKYSVKIVTLRVHKGKSENFEITIKAGETVEKIITY